MEKNNRSRCPHDAVYYGDNIVSEPMVNIDQHPEGVNMDDYTQSCLDTWLGGEEKLLRSFLGIGGESGEVLEALKKHKRGDFDIEELKRRVKGELGDILYYVAMCAHELGFTLSEVATLNTNKLTKRKEDKTLQGEGSDR